MKTKTRYYWLCTYTLIGGEKTVIIGHAKTNKPLLFTSQANALLFLRKTGLADYACRGKCKCVLKEVKV